MNEIRELSTVSYTFMTFPKSFLSIYNRIIYLLPSVFFSGRSGALTFSRLLPFAVTTVKGCARFPSVTGNVPKVVCVCVREGLH